MENIKLNISNQTKNIAVAMLCLAATPAFAQANSMGLCSLLSYIKSIIATVAVLAVLLYVINSFFGKSSLLGEIIEKVLIGCVIAVGAGFLINSTGLQPTTCI